MASIKVKDFTPIAAMICITIIEYAAIINGIDGYLLCLVIAILSGLGGYKIKDFLIRNN